ncbi:restriction endonuclease subunit S [Paraclostridium dentum]|uniref:restriction endonuclease subunit S n=1 Tax=Paraclostridium dentum TaxID=2662455 RepID=UPI001475DB1C|nr:restriction endonuclease subunit S [Paraclostridium dentum]
MKGYKEYKDSGVEWIGKIPSHWEKIELKHIIKEKITDGPHETPEFIDEGVPFLSVDGIVDGDLVFDGCRYISTKSHNEYIKKCKPEYNDILFGKSASVGKVARVKENIEFSVWSPLALIKPDENIVNPVFLEYYLKSNVVKYEIDMASTFNTQQNVSMDRIKRIKVILPRLEEQYTIARYLDKKTVQIDTLISKKEELIENLKASRTKIISETVTKGLDKDVPMKDSGVEWIGEIPKHWSICKIKHMLEEGKDGIRMGPFGSNLKLDEMNLEYEYKVYGQENLIYQDFELGDRFINYQKFSTMKQYEVFDGDILISTMGTVGKIDIFNDKYKKGIIDSHLIRVRVNSKLISPEYIKLLINESKYIKDNLNMQSKGSIMEGLNSTIIKNIVVARPPVSEQISITEYITNNVSKIDKLISKTEEQIELLKKAKQKLITEVVTGKIDVTNL